MGIKRWAVADQEDPERHLGAAWYMRTGLPNPINKLADI
jgi:hypothetical protein